jgi:hypothetical protein
MQLIIQSIIAGLLCTFTALVLAVITVCFDRLYEKLKK